LRCACKHAGGCDTMMNEEGKMKNDRTKLNVGRRVSRTRISSCIIHHASFCPQQRAFTLLELLLAVLVFSIVLGAIHVVFFSAFKLRNKTADAIERSLPLQQTLVIIKRDLANLAP